MARDPQTVRLVDRDEALVAAWMAAFEGVDRVAAEAGDLFAVEASALVSPANSFGIMDGGLDLAIRGRLGDDVERAVQDVIAERHHGELPVGMADVVATGDARWPWLVVAPTMRVPEPVAGTANAYLAFRAALLAVRRFNETAGAHGIESLVVPGLATGYGRMPPEDCARQMRMAWDQVVAPVAAPTWAAAHESHRRLLGGQRD